MMSSGPRAGFFVSTFASVHGLRFADAAWKIGLPGGRHGEGLVELLGFHLAHGVGEREAELVMSERDRTAAVRRVPKYRPRGLQRGDRQWEDTPERRRVDRHRHRGQAPTSQDLRQEPAERVTDDDRLLRQPADDPVEVVRHLAHRLVREDPRVGVRLLDGFGIVRPAWRQRRVAGLLEDPGPAIPAAGQQP